MQNLKKRNRTAFTVVELVIVIAVIAILAGVLIPTFGGIIKQANISADRQMAAQITTTLSMDLDGTKDAAELYKAVADTFGEEVANNLAPKSAKHGYHFWYDISNNRVVLAQYSELAELASPIAYASGSYSTVVADRIYLAESEEDEPLFEAGSLRTFDVTDDEKGDFYFMDKGGEIGEAMSRIEAGREVGATDEDKAAYDEALALLNEIAADSSNATQLLAEAILEKLGGVSKVIDFDIKASGIGVKKASTNWHAAYNIIDLGLSAENFKYDTGIGTSTSVKWSYLPSAAETESGKTYASINEATGAVTLYPSNIIEAGASELTFKAVADAGVEDAEGNKYSETVTVCIDYPTDLNFTIGGGTYSIYDESLNITLSSKDNASFTFEFDDATLKIEDGPDVGCDTEVNVVAGSGNLFSIAKSGDKYVLTVNNLDNYTGVSQSFTITVGSAIEETFTVTVTDLTAEPYQLNEPFDDPKFLYRVGNGNAIPLRVFFKNDQPGDENLYIYDIVKSTGNSHAHIGATAGFTATVGGNTSASGEWAISPLNWKDTEIKFSGTGTAKIKLGEVSIDVEVVDGNNVIPSADGSKKYITSPTAGTNVILLTDAYLESGRYTLKNSTLFGNDFTFNVTEGNYSAEGYISNNYVVGLNNSTLDNVRIIGKAFTAFGYVDSDNNNICNVYSTGNSVIANSYISGCAAPVRLVGGTLEIVGSTLSGGSLANLDFRNGTLTLDNVTTINQKSVNGQSASTGSVGLGIAIWYESVTSCNITIKNNLVQYNHLTKEDINKISFGAGALVSGSSIAAAVFNSSNAAFIYTDNTGDKWVNTGILAMISTVNLDNFNCAKFNGYETTYKGQPVSESGFSGFLYSVKKESVVLENPGEYTSAGQYYVKPSYVINNSSNADPREEGNNDYCIMEGEEVIISFDQNESKVFSLDGFMTASKYGNPLTLTNVYLDNVAKGVGGKLTFDAGGTYTLKFVFDDVYNYGIDGKTDEVDFVKEITVTVYEVAPEAKHAEFSFNGTAGNKVFASGNTYISANVNTTDSSWGSIIVDDQTIYYPIVNALVKKKNTIQSEYQGLFPVFKNVITITDYENSGTGDAITYTDNGSETVMPSGLAVVKGTESNGGYTGDENFANVDDSTLSKSGPANVFQWANGDGKGSSTPKYDSDVKVYAYYSPENLGRSGKSYWIVQYSYTDNVGSTFYYYVGYLADVSRPAYTGSSCVTPDTLVTLADGTQKEIQYVTYEDQLLAWNHFTGEYATVPAAVLVNHGEGEYTIITLKFDDGTEVKVVNNHEFFNADTNKWVYIDEYSVADYLGANFIRAEDNSYTSVKLVDYSVHKEVTEAYSIFSAFYYNCFVENMLSLTPSMFSPVNYYVPFEIGENLKFDEAAMQADIEKYGLYTYEDFKDYATYEQFVGFNAAYLKVSVGKGLVTFEQLIESIYTYVNAQ